MNRPITSTEVGNVILKIPKNKSPGPGSYTGEINQTFRELSSILQKLFQKLQRKEHSQAYSMRPPSPWHPNQTSIQKKKKRKKERKNERKKKESYRPIALMNIDVKILNKVIANLIQIYMKIYSPWSSGIYPRGAEFLHYSQINHHDTPYQQTEI